MEKGEEVMDMNFGQFAGDQRMLRTSVDTCYSGTHKLD